MPVRQLRRVRWAVRAALALGVAASVAANVLHAEPNPIAQTIAAWPPLALLLNVELISRVPMHRRHLAGVRLVATAAIAGIAAWVSYWHMVAVAARYGEVGSVPYLLPISVDGLVIVASVSLVELAGRIRLDEQRAATSAPVAAPTPAASVPSPVAGAPAPSPVPAGAGAPGTPAGAAAPAAQPSPLPAGAGAHAGVAAPHSPAPAVPLGSGVTAGLNGTSGTRRPARTATVSGAGQTPADRRRPARVAAAETRPARTTGKVSMPADRPATPRPGARKTGFGRGTAGSGSAPAGTASPRPRRPVAETLRLIEEITAERPHATDDELADALGITLRRLRTVRSAA